MRLCTGRELIDKTVIVTSNFQRRGSEVAAQETDKVVIRGNMLHTKQEPFWKVCMLVPGCSAMQSNTLSSILGAQISFVAPQSAARRRKVLHLLKHWWITTNVPSDEHH